MKVVVPFLPESTDGATISALHVKEGDSVTEGQILLELETDKVVLEVPAVANGSISKLSVLCGDFVASEQMLMELSGPDVSLYEKTETVEVDPESYYLEEENESSLAKEENNFFGFWMAGLVVVIFIVALFT